LKSLFRYHWQQQVLQLEGESVRQQVPQLEGELAWQQVLLQLVSVCLRQLVQSQLTQLQQQRSDLRQQQSLIERQLLAMESLYQPCLSKLQGVAHQLQRRRLHS
jgi:hypothetical protein